MLQGKRTGSNPNVVDFSTILQALTGKPGNASYVAAGGGMGGRRGTSKPSKSGSVTTAKLPEGYSTYGTYTVGGIEYDIASGRPTYMPPGSVYPSSSVAPIGGTPAERAQAAETSRVAQLTAQDPELQRYEKARAAAKTQEEMNAARDIGMAIWARSNPKLAAKVKPGQSGYEVIQNEINAGQMGPVTDLPFDTTKPFSPTPIPPEQRSVTYEGVRPAMLGEVTPITGGGFPVQQAAMFERFRQSISPTVPSFQGSPLGTASPLVGNLSYTGSVSPLGTAVEGGDFRSEQAQKLAEMFKKAQFAS